jgi:hypothetical protein
MGESQVLTSVVHRATHILGLSELSPHRTLGYNYKYVSEQKNNKTYNPNDLLNYRIMSENFQMSHLLEIGPLLVCTDEIALREITNIFYHSMNPERYRILYMISKIFGGFDIKEIFNYVDAPESDPTSYKHQKKFFDKFKKELLRVYQYGAGEEDIPLDIQEEQQKESLSAEQSTENNTNAGNSKNINLDNDEDLDDKIREKSNNNTNDNDEEKNSSNEKQKHNFRPTDADSSKKSKKDKKTKKIFLKDEQIQQLMYNYCQRQKTR